MSFDLCPEWFCVYGHIPSWIDSFLILLVVWDHFPCLVPFEFSVHVFPPWFYLNKFRSSDCMSFVFSVLIKVSIWGPLYFWPPDANSQLIGKDPDARNYWRQKEKRVTGWNGWMASQINWTWTWENFRRWWGTRKSGVLQSMGSQSQTRLGDWTTYIYQSLELLRWYGWRKTNDLKLSSVTPGGSLDIAISEYWNLPGALDLRLRFLFFFPSGMFTYSRDTPPPSWSRTHPVLGN